ncbi:MAG: cadherin-like beta sandwich domain-containing protein [Clostridiales bacterium]|nr:cadherin-like beta sandwich domain-containing protein [Clostridiales bacterium]
MKRFSAVFALLLLITGFNALAAEAPISDAPYLTAITFENAEIDGGFDSGETVFDLTLTDNTKSPSIKSFEINGQANLLINYIYDISNHQTGISVTLQFDSGSIIYTFNYTNAESYSAGSNANLAGLSCEYAEIVPEINSSDTSYKLYIPYDLTELNLTPVTEDINAYCAPQSIILAEGQETTLKFTVTAPNGDTKVYEFSVKRVEKTLEEVKLEMESDDYTSFVKGEMFYQKPEFYITVPVVAAGAAVIIVLFALTRRLMINPYDSEEPEFYAHNQNKE